MTTAIDLFAGPGGWDVACQQLGISALGIEWDLHACLTALAAGHKRLWADVSTLDPRSVADAYEWDGSGVIASPPCQAWSMAGKRKGELDRAQCHAVADRLAVGDDEYATSLPWEDARSPLVCEPVRWVRDLRPQWVCLEEVPAVASLWEHFARIYRAWGYSVWTGDLNSADYGIIEPCPMHVTEFRTSAAASAGRISATATALGTAQGLATTWPDEVLPNLAATVADRLANRIRPAFAGSATCAERAQMLVVLGGNGVPITPGGLGADWWTTVAISECGLTPDTAASTASLLSNCLADYSLAEKWCTTSTATRQIIARRTLKCIAATLITGCGTGPAIRGAGCGLCVDIAVPQTRTRRILIARRDGRGVPPEPTHAEFEQAADLFGGGGRARVSMAQALGWGEETQLRHPRGAGMVERHGERDDRAGGEPAMTVTGKARSWVRMGNVTGTADIIRGDARHLPLADNTVDLVVTSPPYVGLRSYQDGGEHYDGQIGDEPTPAEFVDALLDVTRECMRVLKPSGSLWVNLGDKYAQNGGGGVGSSDGTTGRGPRPARRLPPGMRDKSLMGIPWRYALRCIDDLGLILRAEVIWSKPNSMPESVTDRVHRSHEQWFHFTLNPRYYSAVDEIREQYAPDSLERRVKYGKAGAGRGYAQGDRNDASRGGPMGFADADNANPLGKLPGSVWTVPTQPLQVPDWLGVKHYAAFPMEFPRRIIRGWSPAEVCSACGEGRRPVTRVDREGDCSIRRASDRGFGVAQGDNRNPGVFTITGYACACPDMTAPATPGVVLDPFSGTGTVALVAKALGRHGIGVDMSADYCRLAEWRTNDPKQLAQAAEREYVPPPKPIDGQLGMFEEAG